MTDQKENDMLLNVMENPSFSIQDFQDIGLNVQNTSLQSKDVYQNSPQIQENTLFQDSKGNFDPTKFATVYNTAAKVYNTMATTAQNQDSDFKVQYSKYNISQWKRLELGEITREQVKVNRYRLLFDELGLDLSPEDVTADYEENLCCEHYFIDGALEAIQAFHDHPKRV